jgi:hypothetical protein
MNSVEQLEILKTRKNELYASDLKNNTHIRKLCSEMASVYTELKEYDNAKDQLLEAYLLIGDIDDSLEIMHSIANTYHLLAIQTDYMKYNEIGKRWNLDAMEVCKLMKPYGHPDIGKYTSNVAYSYEICGELDVTLELLLEVLTFYKRFLPIDHPDIDTTLLKIASLYNKNGDFDKEQEMLNQRISPLKKYPSNSEFYKEQEEKNIFLTT